MVEIGEHPILWHILKLYTHRGFQDFGVALGQRGEQIKRYFLDYRELASDPTLDLQSKTNYLH